MSLLDRFGFKKGSHSSTRLRYTQGDFGLFQCSIPCCQETYDNEAQLKRMVEATSDMKIPTDLIPHCPHCGAEMDFSLFWDQTFFRDAGAIKEHRSWLP